MNALARMSSVPPSEAAREVSRLCGARRFVDAIVAGRPYPDVAALHAAADAAFSAFGRDDWLEAFAHHPRIGDVDSLRERFAETAAWASGEQAGAAAAGEEVLRRLADGNRAYEARYGHIFIVCATGRSAAEMLALLEARIGNPPDEELAIAAGEQAKITHIRIDKLVSGGG